MRDRRVLAAIAAVVAGAGAALAIALGGGGSGGPPAAQATKLVPATALVYVHLSTDLHRAGTRRARALAVRFDAYASLRDRIVSALSAPSCKTNVAQLHGREAALALLPGRGATTGSLVLVDTGHDHAAPQQRSCGRVSVRYIGRFLAIGQPVALQAAQALHDGHGRSLADDSRYRRATGALPAGRVADAWATAAGVRRLLAPQGGVLGAAGVLLDQPGLLGVAAGLTAGAHGATVMLRSIVDPAARGHPTFATFTPTLQSSVPADALAYVGVEGLASAAQRLLEAAGSSSSSLDALARRLRGGLDPSLLALFAGETAIVLEPTIPVPTLTIIARARDEAGTRRALARFEAPLAKALRGRFGPITVAGVPARALLAGGAVELAYAVFDGKLVVATKPEGIAAVKAGGRRLPDTAAWKATIGTVPKQATSLLFLDFTQLLRLGEQTGLNDSRAYQAAKDDLQRVQAVGAHASGAGDESTAELLLSIP